MAKDALSVRMKEFYENRTQVELPRRTYTILRLDGRSFKNYTRGLKKPFDDGLIEDMNETAIYLCKNIQGAKIGFVQSDEITIVLTDFDTLQTDAWFNGEIQKMVSISASIATSKFNQLRLLRKLNENPNIEDLNSFISTIKLAEFDSRVFTIPFKEEVLNCLIWRQQDCTRNSISTVAQWLYPNNNDLKGKNQSDMQEMCFQKGVNWNDFPEGQKRGRVIIKRETIVNNAVRNKWVAEAAPIFSQDRTLFDEKVK